MPNWKKVIVSGSNAILNNITSSGDISASGDIYATNFYGNFEGTIDSASHATEALVSGINSFGNFPVVFSNNNVLYKDSDSGDFTYDPSSNTLVVDNISGTASLATTASYATEILVNELNNSSFYDIVFNNNSVLYKDDTYGEFAYNPSTNTLRAPNIIGTASLATTASYATFAGTISISNDSNNRITTTNGNGTLNAEQNLSFNGSTLELTGSLTVDANNPITIKGQVGNVITIRDEGSTDIIKIGDVDLNDGETLITINDNSNTITLNATNKLDVNANIDASNYNITASIVSASSFIGDLTGTSTLASNLTGTPSIVVNNITSSGDVSASGDLYSTHVFIPQGVTTGDAGLIFGDTIAGNSGYVYDDGSGKLHIGYNDSDKLSISDTNEALLLAGNTRITGHITASKSVSVSGDLIVGGNITANQYIVSSSVTYMTQSFSSGSTIFGDTQDDTHQFTGSVDITGSLSILGFTDVSASLASKGNVNTTGTPSDNQIAVFTNSNTIEGNSNFTYDGTQLSLEGGAIFNTANDDVAFQYKGSSDDNLLQVNPQSGDKVGIGTATPPEKLTVEGNISASGALISSELTASGLNYPNTDGDDGQVLLTDGSGKLTFGDVKVYAQVKNISGVTLAKGTPVHATASVSPPAGNVSEVIAASASLASSMPATFVLDEELANEAEGRAILSGFINGVDTSAFNEGDVVYVGENGGYTTTKPTGTNLIQNLGIITKVDASNGAGYIYGSGRSNDVPNIPSGYAWVGNSDGVATAVPTSSFAGVGDNLGNHTATQDLDMAGFSISASLNITASGNISASGYVSADHLILNPNTTTTGSSDTDAAVNISLGDEEYKRGVIKRVFNFREVSADSINISDRVIANVGDFKKGTFEVTFEIYGWYSPGTESVDFNNNTASINQNFHHSSVSQTQGPYGSPIDVFYEDGSNIGNLLQFIPGGVASSLLTGNNIIKLENNQIKFNPSNTSTINNTLSGSLLTIYLDYQLYK